jgi:hypothetical protein
MNFSLLCQVSEAQDQLHLSRHLRVHNIQLPDPFKMNVLNDLRILDFSPLWFV